MSLKVIKMLYFLQNDFQFKKQINWVKLRFIFIRIQFVFATMLSQAVLAATIDFGPNGCTLQDAIRSANNDNAIGNCSAGSGFDNLIGPDGWQITLNSRLPTITSDLSISTNTNSGSLILDGDNDSAIMRITGVDTDVVLNRLVFTKANAGSIRGPALHIEDADVDINHSVFSLNRSRARYGGAIYIKDGNLSVNRSHFSFNVIYNTEANISYGGAIYADESTVLIEESQFFSNRAKYDLISDGCFICNIDTEYISDGRGSSVSVLGGNIDISQSTFNDDQSSVHGIGAVANIVNSTFNRLTPLQYIDTKGHVFFTDTSALTLNHVTIDAALRVENSILSMTNSILQGECNIAESTSWIVDQGNLYNTLGQLCPDTGNLFYYPRLLNLDYYGGYTQTFKLHHNSEAINAGDPNYCAEFDQRGEARGSVCDIGAYEAADLIDVQMSNEVIESAPFVHNQEISYLAKIKNNSSSVLDEVRVSLDSAGAVVTEIDYFQCANFPCILRGIQPQQEIIIPVNLSLSSFQPDFRIDVVLSRTVNSTYIDFDESNDNDFVTGDISDGADLAVDMTLNNPGNHFIGQLIQYDIQVDNYGFNTAVGTQLILQTTGLNVLNFSGCVTANTNSCELGNLLNGGTVNLTVTAVIEAASFNAEIGVTSDLFDLNLANNTDDQGNGGSLDNSDLSIEASIDVSGPHYSYDYMKFKVKIATGNEPASNIRIWEHYPGAEFIGCIGGFWNLLGYCEVASIAANSTHEVSFDYFNPINTIGEQEEVEFWSFAEPGEIDVNLSDNESVINVPVDAVADMVAQLSLTTQPPYYSSQEIQFNLRILNAGVNHATGVQADYQAENLELVWATGDLCVGLPCELPQLDRFNEDNITLVYRIIEAGDFQLVVGTEADQDDLNEANNIELVSGTAEPGISDVIFTDSFESQGGN